MIARPWPKVFAVHRRTVMTSRFLVVRGRLQRAGLVIHVVASSFLDLSNDLHDLADGEIFDADGGKISRRSPSERELVKSRDFH